MHTHFKKNDWGYRRESIILGSFAHKILSTENDNKFNFPYFTETTSPWDEININYLKSVDRIHIYNTWDCLEQRLRNYKWEVTYLPYYTELTMEDELLTDWQQSFWSFYLDMWCQPKTNSPPQDDILFCPREGFEIEKDKGTYSYKQMLSLGLHNKSYLCWLFHL